VTPGVKMRRVGASARAYSAGVQKVSEVKVNVSEHGYVLKANVTINYNALTEKQAAKAHTLVMAALSEAITDAGQLRKVNVPLFAIDDLTPSGTSQGINTL
jgi:hypothetical protein